VKKDGKINFKRPPQPLLFNAGEKDNIIPSSLNKKNYEAYQDANSRKDFNEFPGRTHYLCGQQDWQEIASFIHEWISVLK
jgi:predicted esterase